MLRSLCAYRSRDVKPFLESTFDNEELSWMNMDPLTHPKDLNIIFGWVLSRLRGSRQNPIFESSHVEDIDDDNSYD